FAAHGAAVPVQRGEADQRGDLPAVQGAQLAQAGEQGDCYDAADAWCRAQQILLLAPQRAVPNCAIDVPVGQAEPPLQPIDVLRNVLPGCLGSGHSETVLLGGDHVHQLPPSSGQGLELLGLSVRKWLGFRFYRLGEAGQHVSVDRVSLGQPTQGPGELAHLPRIDHAARNTCRPQRRRDGCFVPPGRLHDHPGRPQFLDPIGQSQNAGVVVRLAPALAPGGGHVQPRLGHIDSHVHANALLSHSSFSFWRRPTLPSLASFELVLWQLYGLRVGVRNAATLALHRAFRPWVRTVYRARLRPYYTTDKGKGEAVRYSRSPTEIGEERQPHPNPL